MSGQLALNHCSMDPDSSSFQGCWRKDGMRLRKDFHQKPVGFLRGPEKIVQLIMFAWDIIVGFWHVLAIPDSQETGFHPSIAEFWVPWILNHVTCKCTTETQIWTSVEPIAAGSWMGRKCVLSVSWWLFFFHNQPRLVMIGTSKHVGINGTDRFLGED